MIDSERRHLLPELIRFACDPRLDGITRCWIFDALRDVSGEAMGDTPEQWVRWYAAVTGENVAPPNGPAELATAECLRP